MNLCSRSSAFRPRPLWRGVFALVVALAVAEVAPAAVSEWSDVLGNRFTAEPTEILGPFALFRTSAGRGRRVALRGLAPEACQRLFRELATKPAVAARWSDAHGLATKELAGHLSRVIEKKLQPVATANLAEPELLLVFAGGNNGESWFTAQNLRPLYFRLERVFPGRLATVFIGTAREPAEYENFAIATGMPWLVADYQARGSLSPITRFLAPEGASLLLVTREGTPLLSAAVGDLSSVKKFTDDLLELLWAINPRNARSWPERIHYLTAVRPLEYADATTGPLFVGNAMLVDGLRRHGIQRISARVEVGGDGRVTGATLLPDAVMPASMASSLAAVLPQYLRYVPGIDHGKPVAGAVEYALDVPAPKTQLDADTAWLGEARVDVPIASWLVLRPIHVPEGAFGEIDHVDAAGRVIMKAIEVSKDRIARSVQLGSFNSDWFGAEGAATVHPVEGGVQEVDGSRLTWRKIVPADGLVDLAAGMGNSDFCVGYAWTEIDVPAEVDAWLGIGSDDGLKIWHNGVLVADRWIRRQSLLDDDVVPLRLKKGKNQLLIKIQNMTIDWSFIARLRTR